MDIKFMQKPVWNNNFKMQENNYYNDQNLIQSFKSVIINQLTFNSKPIISELTDIAKRSIASAPIIVNIVENHLREVNIQNLYLNFIFIF